MAKKMLTSLRYLLIVLLPFAGWWVGNALVPKPTVAWQKTFDSGIGVLGYIDDKTVLLSVYDSDQTIKQLIGLSVNTGELLFQKELPADVKAKSVRGVRLSKDGKTLVLLGITDGNQIVLYDWTTNTIQGQYSWPQSIHSINQAVLTGNRVIAHLLTTKQEEAISYVAVWDIGSEEPPTLVMVGEQSNFLEVSDDGRYAVINTITNKRDEVVLVDTVNGKVIQKVPGYFEAKRWSPDGQHLRVVDSNKDALVLRDFTNIENHFQEQGQSRLLLTTRGSIRYDSHYLVIRSWDNASSWRTKNQQRLPKWVQEMVNQFWPLTPIVTVHDPVSGTVLRRWIFPVSEQAIDFAPANLDLMLQSYGKQLVCWRYAESIAWPRWAGLIIGIILSVLVLRQLLLRKVTIPRSGLIQTAPETP